MANQISYAIITVHDKEFLKGFIWEICSQGLRMYSRGIIESKTNCWISMVRIAKRHYNVEPNPARCKTREIQFDDIRYP